MDHLLCLKLACIRDKSADQMAGPLSDTIGLGSAPIWSPWIRALIAQCRGLAIHGGLLSWASLFTPQPHPPRPIPSLPPWGLILPGWRASSRSRDNTPAVSRMRSLLHPCALARPSLLSSPCPSLSLPSCWDRQGSDRRGWLCPLAKGEQRVPSAGPGRRGGQGGYQLEHWR